MSNETLNVEIFENGTIRKLDFVPELNQREADGTILDLCNRIRKEDPAQGKTVLEYVMTEICRITQSDGGTIWRFKASGDLKTSDKKRKSLICKYELSLEEYPFFDDIVKRFTPKANKTHILISDDALYDERLKRKKIRKRRPSLQQATPSASAPLLKTSTAGLISSQKNLSSSTSADPKNLKNSKPSGSLFISTYSIMILPLGTAGQMALKASFSKKYSIKDVANIVVLCHLIENALEKHDYVEDGIISALNTVKKSSETNDVKDVFLAAVSHDLRTPLNGIVGMIGMLKDAGPLNPKQEDYLTILMECSHQLMNMTNNLLDYSKLASKRLVLTKSPMDISKTVRDSILMVEGKAKAKGVELIVNVQRDIPLLLGDSQRLVQVLSNLLSNAVKFTEKGSVKIDVKGLLQPDSTSDALPYVKKWKIQFQVEDTGIGIAKEDHERIFDVFSQSKQLDTFLARSGTGLGLSISKELVKMMKGNIKVHSDGLGRGSIFKFYILAEEELKIAALDNTHKDLIKKSRILVVDDRAEYRLQLTDMLLKWGCKPTVVSSGEEALQYVDHGLIFDSIIVDICMPYMSGIELAQNLKERSNSRCVPLIALSSIDLSAGVELFDVYMNKPIDQNFLFPALLECLIKKNTTGSTVVEDVETPLESHVERYPQRKSSALFTRKDDKVQRRKKVALRELKILIAEDDQNNAYTLREMLMYIGVAGGNVKWVENGAKCVEEVRARPYDIVLMDIVMPVMDGIEATKHIRQLNPRPYIVAVSAAVQNSDKQRCHQAGIDGYLPKPILKEKLKACISHLVLDLD